MSKTGCPISEAAKMTEVDPHVLRYWEEELELPIARNKMGHRSYTRQDIQNFQDIKELKKKGLQLKEIKQLLRNRMEAAGTVEMPVLVSEEKEELEPVQKESRQRQIDEEKQQQFQEILARLLHQVIVAEHREGRYKRLDEAIRRHQESRRMIAVTEEEKKKRKHGKKTKDKNRILGGCKDG